MSEEPRRQVLAHGAIGIAACIGGYMLLVDGARTALVGARAQAQSLEAEVRAAEGLLDQVPAMSKALERTDREAADILRLGRPAREQRGLYAAITSLAAANSVRLDELNPIAPSVQPKSAEPTSAAATAPADTAIAYNMVGVCSYEQATTFLAGLRTQLGFSIIRSVRLIPLQDERARLVRVVVETEHYSFDPVPKPAVTADAGGR